MLFVIHLILSVLFDDAQDGIGSYLCRRYLYYVWESGNACLSEDDIHMGIAVQFVCLFWVLDVLKLSGVGQAPFHLYHSLLRDLVHSGDLCPFGLAVQFQPTKRFALPASLTDSEYSYQDRRTWLEISSAFCGEPWKPQNFERIWWCLALPLDRDIFYLGHFSHSDWRMG